METLLELLDDLKPDVDFRGHTALIEDGVLDSFDLVILVGELNANFDIQIGVEDLMPENFNSVAAMMALIERLQDA